jgi:hypothetical protein
MSEGYEYELELFPRLKQRFNDWWENRHTLKFQYIKVLRKFFKDVPYSGLGYKVNYLDMLSESECLSNKDIIEKKGKEKWHYKVSPNTIIETSIGMWTGYKDIDIMDWDIEEIKLFYKNKHKIKENLVER